MANDGADEPVARHGGSGVATWAGLALTCLGYYLGLKPTGIWATALGAVLTLFSGAALFAWGLLVRHYTRALKDAHLKGNTPHRRPYRELRAGLVADSPTIRYEDWLRRAMGRVDRFFGDADPAAASCYLGPRLFGLTEPASLWTPAAYDRCLLLALVYPLVVILVMWLATGRSAGPAELALGL